MSRICSVSIIVPIYNAIESARHCLAAVYSVSTGVPFEVIAVDNGSSPRVGEWLSSEARRHENLTVLHFDQPLGFARAVNEGARKAKSEFIAVLTSDVVVENRWLDRLLEAIQGNPNIGIAGPVTNHAGPGSQLVAAPPEPDAGLALIEEPRRLFFFCVIIRRAMWEMLGGLDEVYKVGTYEDDDFCLRARVAGWALAIVPSVFVFNGASETFHDNRIDREECIFHNETVFLERASRLSRSPASVWLKKELPAVSVLIAVPSGAADKLTDSLCSLANQTVTGFEVVIVARHAEPLPELPPALLQSLNIRRVAIIDDGQCGPAPFWNAGLDSAAGDLLAYLPAGDIYLPYHLETLHHALTANGHKAACSGWSVAIHGETGAKRAPVKTGGAQPLRHLDGEWNPLLCWMHTRDCRPEHGFRREFRDFSEWEFTLRLSTGTKVWFEPAITCERNRWTRDKCSNAADAESVMSAYPVPEESERNFRRDFLAAVRAGIWEETLVVRRREQAHRVHRVRRLLNRRMSATSVAPKVPSPAPGQVDFIFFNILGWADLTQRPHHFAAGLSQRGHRVFWIDVQLIPRETFTAAIIARELAANIFEVRLPGFAGAIYHVPWTPAILDSMAGALGQLRNVNGIDRAVQFVNFPRWRPLVERLREDLGWPIVYDCLDDQYAFGELYGQNVSEDEAELTRICDALTTSGHVLFETKRKQRPDAIQILNAGDYNLFRASASSGLPSRFPRPVIGFFGAFCDWLDLDWVDAAARRFPSWTFVYIGREGFSCKAARERWRAATSHPNVHVLPQTDLTKLAACLRDFDVCIMPFQNLPITRSMHPVKIYEYLAAGKHILVPALPEMQPFADRRLLTAYRSHSQSFELLEALVARPPAADEILARTSFAAQNDWGERLDRLLDAIKRRGLIETTVSAPETGA